ncbi:MAG: hypothetical protein ACYTFW_03840 [Planctomycetota bacterium]
MRQLMMVLIVGMLIIAGPVLGGPLEKKQVVSSANWVVHADYEQFINTRIGQLIREELTKQGLDEKLKDFTALFGFHPLNDVRDVTIYGNGQDREKAVVLIEGRFDTDKLVSLVRMNPDYEEIGYGSIVVHSWIDENQRDADSNVGQKMYGCMYKDDLVVMSAGLEAVKKAVDVFNGSTENVTNSTLSQRILDAKGAFFQVAANSVSQIVEQNQQTAVLRQTDELSLFIGETEGNFYIDLDLKAKSEQAAQNISKMLDGIIAFAALAEEEQPKLAELAKKLRFSCALNTVQIHFESNSQAVFEFLKEQWEKKRQEEDQVQ